MTTRYTVALIAFSCCTMVSAQMVQKCCGTSNSTFLLGNATALHSQCIYTPGDLTNAQAGEITRLYYRYGTTGEELGNKLDNFMIRLVQTTATTFTANTFFTGLDTVMTRDTLEIHPGISFDWFALDLDSTFDYDPTLTLIVDLSFTDTEVSNFGTASTSMAGRKLYWNDITSPTGQSVVSSWQDVGFDLILSTSMAEEDVLRLQTFPNPATDVVNLVTNARIPAGSNVALVDASGRTVSRHATASRNNTTFSVRDLAPGLYTLILDQPSGGRITQRLMIAR